MVKAVKCVCATDVGLVRERNEDACFAGAGCCAVADGLGGHRAGEVASQIAIQVVEQELSQRGLDGFDMERCIKQANARVLDASRHADALEGMGTTLTMAVMGGDTLRVGHVGDSRAYLLNAGGIEQLTEDHSVVGEMLRSGLITVEEAAAHPSRHAITRALGFFDDLEVDVIALPVQPGDVVVLCTDGLHDLVTPEEIYSALWGSADPSRACRDLVSLARSRGGYDNITIAAGVVLESDTPEGKRGSEPEPEPRPGAGPDAGFGGRQAC